MKFKISLYSACAASVICAVMASGSASAQTSDDHSDIVVTARRVEERLQDVPISITVFSQQELSKRNIISSSDLAIYTPSLSANTNFGSDNTTFAIRGFVQDTGTQPSVGVYFGDVVAPRGASSNLPTGDGAGPGSFFDLQNVQVLKGPQGTLFGRNTTGGAVLFVPQKPTGRFEGYVEGSIGNYGMKRIQAAVNAPLGDNARLRIGVDRMTRDGYVTNTSGIGPSDWQDVSYTAVRASLVVDLTPNLENYTIASYAQSNNHGPAQKLVACDTSTTAPALASLGCAALARNASNDFYTIQNVLPNPFVKTTQWQLINTTTWRASDTLTIKNIASYAQYRQQTNTPLFGVALNTADFKIPGVPGITFPPSTIPFATNTSLASGYTADQSTFTEELQFQGRTSNDKLTYQGGAYLEVSEPLSTVGSQSSVLINCSNSATFQCTDPTAPTLNFLTGLGGGSPSGNGLGTVSYGAGRTHFHNVGLYTQASYSITDQLKLTGGIRYTWDRVRAESQSISYKFDTPNTPIPFCTLKQVPQPCYVSYVQKSGAPTWLVGLDYKPIDNLLIYAKYVRGYRAGGISPQAPAIVATFNPEHVDTYEGGIKASIPGALHATLNVSGFYNNFRNQQLQLNLVSTSGNTPYSAVYNAGKSRIYGAEIEASIVPFTGLSINGSYAYLNTRLQQITSPVIDPATGFTVPPSLLQAGDPLILSPKNKYTVTGTYTLPLDESVGRISFGATFSHTDSQLGNYSDLRSTVPVFQDLAYLKPRDLLNLNFDWHGVLGSAVDLSAFATNVTKQKYYSFTTGLANATGFDTVPLGEPRMYGMRLRYRFGS